jgi:hypothetical protein
MQNNIFEDVMYNNVPRNSFDLSHDRKFSAKLGRLYPCLVQEIVPGDSFSVQSEQLIRMAPLVSPVMHRVTATTHYFFVPNRLLWEGWEYFITNPLDNKHPAPVMLVGSDGIKEGSIADYLGYPTGDIPEYTRINPLPASAYALIYNEYYRDQNLQKEGEFELLEGVNNDPFDFNLFSDEPLRRAWNKDYFTSALSEPQKGEAVTLPLGASADINYTNNSRTRVYDTAGNPIDSNSLNLATVYTGNGGLEALNKEISLDVSDSLEVDLSSATAITVEDLRRATRLQEWLEINARGGTRYIESIQNHFGVKSPDARLQRPEYLGGGKSNISFSEVLQTSSSDQTTPQGNMSGHGINVGNSNRMDNVTFTEHGFIIGIFSVMPETAYMNSTPKWSFRFDPLDYLWPKFAQLGEQPVYVKEVNGASITGETVFGYQSRYADYKYNHNTVHGDFKNSLDFWHMARKIDANPVLNEEFIECTPTDRVFAVEDPTVDKMYIHMFHRINARRPLPRYNIPTL